MTGARKFARDYIAQQLPAPGSGRILDVCCGDRWVLSEFPQLYAEGYVGLDLKDGFDVRREGVLPGLGDVAPALILSVYGLQHLLHEEARVWTLLRRIANADTRFIYVGRWYPSPRVEKERADPLNAHCLTGIGGLGLASGWETRKWALARYNENDYEITQQNPNAFAVTLEPIR